MEYKSIEELPDTVRDILPEEAQELYLKGYNQGWEAYDEETSSDLSHESVAHRQGWIFVQKEFVQDEGTGEWHRKGEEAEEEEEGLLDKVQDVFSG
jgi:cation transport regulator